MPRSFLILFLLVLSVAYGAPDTKVKRGSVRLLCVSDDLPIKYVKGADGAESPVFAGADEEPPSTVFVKQGDAYSPLALPRNNVGRPTSTKVAQGMKEPQGYFLKFSASESMTESWLRNMGNPDKAGKKPASGRVPEPKYLPLAKSVPADGKDYLLCLFQPSCKEKWYPPKNLVVDISPDVFPAGAVLLLNFSDRPAFIRPGLDSSPMKLEAGRIHQITSLKDSRNIAMVVGAGNRAGTAIEVVFNRPKSLPEGGRGLVVVYSLYEKNSPKAVGVKFIPMAAETAVMETPGNRTDATLKKTN